MDGILLINKHSGVSSANIVRKIGHLYDLKKIGHAGTLDPFATGLLICCLNKATRLSNFFLSENKVYRGILNFGIETDTGDKTGKLISENSFRELDINKLFNIAANFNGHRCQLPPLFSSLKFRGIPLHKFARSKIRFSRNVRPFFINYFKICDVRPLKVYFEVCCSSGSYIRTMSSSIGKFLDCGACLESLSRISSGFFSVNFAYSLNYIEKLSLHDFFSNCVIPMKNLLNFVKTL